MCVHTFAHLISYLIGYTFSLCLHKRVCLCAGWWCWWWEGWGVSSQLARPSWPALSPPCKISWQYTPPTHTHTHPSQADTHTLNSMANPLSQPVDGRSRIYTCVPLTMQAPHLSHCTPHNPTHTHHPARWHHFLILTVSMVISNRCMCNLSSSVCLFFSFIGQTHWAYCSLFVCTVLSARLVLCLASTC